MKSSMSEGRLELDDQFLKRVRNFPTPADIDNEPQGTVAEVEEESIPDDDALIEGMNKL